ncbi:MAG: hypothetical protein LRY74_10315 [Shewanella xiamenensis]|nr:hypothetical protein [Shewanella xiamenensis]
MKWIILLAALGGVFWAANLSYHLLDNAILITDYWKAQGSVEWGLVHFNAQPENSEVYAFKSDQGYWRILKGLWPISTLFFIGIIVLIPAAAFIINSLTKLQITEAAKSEKNAHEYAKQVKQDAKEQIEQIQQLADKKVQNAQQEARSKAKGELFREIQKLQADQLDLQERTERISAREQAAQDAEIAAQQKVAQVVDLYEQELARFEAEISAMQSSKNNAQQAFKRIKQKSVKES